MLYNRCTGIYKFGNNTYPRRIRRRSNLGHIFRVKKCVLWAGKYGNCSDIQVALKALQAAKTTSPLVQLCQKALNDASTRHTVGLYWVPGHAGVWGNKIADKLARGSSEVCRTWAIHRGFLGGILGIRVNAGWINSIWQCGMVLVVLKDRLEKLISDPSLTTNTSLLTSNRPQSRVVTQYF